MSAVVHVLEDRLKSLAALDNTESDHADAVEGAEDGIIAHTEALHVTNHGFSFSLPYPLKHLGGKVVVSGYFAATEIDGPHNWCYQPRIR